jgi:hypothetical protein
MITRKFNNTDAKPTIGLEPEAVQSTPTLLIKN